jgi:hypothetical protein
MHIDEHGLPCKMVMRDNDKKYPKTFDDVFTTPTCRIKRNVPASPNLQAYVERVIQTLKHKVLNGFCVVSEKHLDHILRRAADWYNHRRCQTPNEMFFGTGNFLEAELKQARETARQSRIDVNRKRTCAACVISEPEMHTIQLDKP